jgi:hypothetical protein
MEFELLEQAGQAADKSLAKCMGGMGTLGGCGDARVEKVSLRPEKSVLFSYQKYLLRLGNSCVDPILELV